MADEQKTDNQAPPGISRNNDIPSPDRATPPPSPSPISVTKTPEMIKYEQMLEKNPSSRVFAPLADLYRKAGMIDEAIALALKGVEKYPKYLSGRVSLGRAYFDKGMHDEARDEMERVVAITPDNLLANKVLGNIYMARGEQDQAAGYFERVLMLSPEDEEVSRILKSIGYSDKKKPKEPAETAKKAVEDDAINSVLRDLSAGEEDGDEIGDKVEDDFGEEFDDDFFDLDGGEDSLDARNEEMSATLDLSEVAEITAGEDFEEDIDDVFEDTGGIQEKMGDDDLAALVADAKSLDDESSLDDDGDGISGFDIGEITTTPSMEEEAEKAGDDTQQEEDSFEFALDSTDDVDNASLSDEIDLSSMIDEIPEEFLAFDQADGGSESISLGESGEIDGLKDSVFTEDTSVEDFPAEFEFDETSTVGGYPDESGDAIEEPGIELPEADLSGQDISMEFDFEDAGVVDESSEEFDDTMVAPMIELPEEDLSEKDISTEFEFDDMGGGEEPPEEFGDTTVAPGIELSGDDLPEQDISMEFEFDDTGGGEEPPEEFGDTMINSGIDLPQGEMPEDDLELSGDSDLLDVPGGEIPGAREGMEEGELLGVDTVSFDTSEEMVELEDPFSTTGGVLDEFVEQDLPTDLFETPSESVAFETQHEDTEFETPTEHSGFDVSQDMEPSLDMEPTSDMGTPPGMKTPGFVEEVGDEEHDMRVDDDIDFHELKAPSKPPEMEDRPLGIHEEFDDDDFPEDMPEDDEDLLLRMGENDEVSDDEGVSITTETIADIYVKQGHFDKAQGIYEELCHAYPENESLREKLGHVQMRIASGQTEESRQNEIAPDTDMSPEDTQQSERAIERLNTWLEDIQKRRRGVP